jgi:hypothetical protein
MGAMVSGVAMGVMGLAVALLTAVSEGDVLGEEGLLQEYKSKRVKEVRRGFIIRRMYTVALR